MISSINNPGRITMGGLATGLDTQSLIKQMTYATQLKIDTKKQSIDRLTWKTDVYRDIIGSANSFKEKFFSFSSKTNLLSSSMYTNGKVSCNSPYVTVSGSSSAAKNIVIKDIQSLASKTTLTSNSSVTDRSLKSGEISKNKQVGTLSGESITLSYNSKNYTVTFDSSFTSTDPNEIAGYINQKLSENKELLTESGDLKISVDVSQGTDAGTQVFNINNATSDGKPIKIAAGTKSALSALGFSVSDSSDTKITSKPIADDAFVKELSLRDTLSDSFLKVNIDGVEKTLVFNDIPQNLENSQDLAAYLNDKLNAAFPGGKASVTFDGDKISIKPTSESSTVTITGAGENILGQKGVLGIDANSSNRINLNSSISDLNLSRPLSGDKFVVKINDKEFSFDKDTSLSTIINTVNSSDAGVNLSYSKTMDKITAESTMQGSSSAVNIEDVSGNLMESLIGTDYNKTQGRDAKIIVSFDGGLTDTVMERGSNSFDLDGLQVKLNSLMENDGVENIKFTVSNNNEELIGTFQSFVDEYNKIIDLLTAQVKAKPNKDYPPLTAEQKSDMSENEIALWEKKAKEGLLYADSDLNNMITELKSSLTSMVGDDLLADLGIKFDNYLSGGKLMFDKDKFSSAIAENPDKLISALTKKSSIDKSVDYSGYYQDSGALTRMSAVIDRYASVYQNKGVLVSKAGMKNTSSEKDNYLSRQIQSYNDQLTKLNRTIAKEQSKYLKQFTALETNINKLNSQSGMFSNQ